jgi:hypothetical protein
MVLMRIDLALGSSSIAIQRQIFLALNLQVPGSNRHLASAVLVVFASPSSHKLGQ